MSTDRHLDDAAVAAEVRATREEYAEEEAEAAEAEAAQNAAALDVPLSMRITRNLDMQIRQRAAAEHISPSALIRRLLHDALDGPRHQALTVEQVEEIARRVMRESA
jgi:predicted DNA binding CopG/RHH family protein